MNLSLARGLYHFFYNLGQEQKVSASQKYAITLNYRIEVGCVTLG